MGAQLLQCKSIYLKTCQTNSNLVQIQSVIKVVRKLGWFFKPPLFLVFFLIGENVDLVKKRTGIEEKFFKIADKVVRENGFDLYDMQYVSGSSTLMVFIMNQETKTADIDECVRVTRAMNPFFEEEEASDINWIPNDIVLEVSSPGMYRSLKTLKHFELVVGDRINCLIQGKLDEELLADAPKVIKKSSSFIGVLKEVKEKNILIDINGFELCLTFEQMKKANLEPEL